MMMDKEGNFFVASESESYVCKAKIKTIAFLLPLKTLPLGTDAPTNGPIAHYWFDVPIDSANKQPNTNQP